MNRRALLLGAVSLLGGAAALTRFTRNTGDGAGARGPVMDAEQFALLEQVSEVMVPATDTPGAIGAGVPAFIRQMLKDWASAESRAQILSVLDGVNRRAWARFGASLVELPPERRTQIVTDYDAELVGRQDPAYSKFKYLVLVGYYQSEIGATQELRFELIPGAWRACVPLTEIGRAAAVEG